MTSLDAPFALSCPTPLPAGDVVLLGHGSGGTLSRRLVQQLFLPILGGRELSRLGDAAVLDVEGVRLAFTTDAFVVQPLEFPGSDIGTLAVNGTVNDLAMMGAVPLSVSAAFILEEGLSMELLGRVAASMAEACRRAEVELVAADTKVVERGSADGMFVITSGVGRIPQGVELGPDRAEPGDAVIVTGPIASHGVAVMTRRAGIEFEAEVVSDTAPLSSLVQTMLGAGAVRCLRDATRGGVASVLNELAESSDVTITLEESAIPMLDPVRAACEVLGLDPLHVANEGVAVAIVDVSDAANIVTAARSDPAGRRAAVVGEVERGPARVRMRTPLGVTRPVVMLAGDQLPRIC
jgi:hydrogenase expression/formation protein HypE